MKVEWIGSKPRMSKADIQRWSREAKRRSRTPNVAYFAARIPKPPSCKQKVLVRRWRARGDIPFAESMQALAMAFDQHARAFTALCRSLGWPNG